MKKINKEKLTFKHDVGYVNGKEVYQIEAYKGETWIHAKVNLKKEFIARFKGRSSKAYAKHFIKFLHENIPLETYIMEMMEGKSPLNILQERGYVSYNILKIRKQRSEK